MAAKPKPTVEEPHEQVADALVLTVSQLNKLTDEEKQKFRANGGTVTNDPT
jgi:hypothetical protein